jgi:hypothetical protein
MVLFASAACTESDAIDIAPRAAAAMTRLVFRRMERMLFSKVFIVVFLDWVAVGKGCSPIVGTSIDV